MYENRLDGDNVELDALRALQAKDTPAEVAQSFKEQRNEKVQMKRWKDAKEYYDKGIAVLAQRKRVRSPRSPDADQSGQQSESGEAAGKSRRGNCRCRYSQNHCVAQDESSWIDEKQKRHKTR